MDDHQDAKEGMTRVRSSQFLIHEIQVGLGYLGLAITGAQSYASFANKAMACPVAFDCERVAASAFGHIGPLPTSSFGFFAFGAITAIAWSEGVWGTVRRVLIIMASIASVLLFGYARFVLGAACLWCLVSQFAFLGLLLTEAFRTHVEALGLQGKLPRHALALAAYALFAGLVLTQGPLQGPSGRLHLEGVRADQLYPPYAMRRNWVQFQPVTVAFVDLNCSHCREYLRKALAKPKPLAVWLYARPGESDSERSAALLAEAFMQGRGWPILSAIARQDAGDPSSVKQLCVKSGIAVGGRESTKYVANGQRLVNELGISGLPLAVRIAPGEQPVVDHTDLP